MRFQFGLLGVGLALALLLAFVDWLTRQKLSRGDVGKILGGLAVAGVLLGVVVWAIVWTLAQ